MIVSRKYEVIIPDETLEWLEKEGYGNGGLIDMCTRAVDEDYEGTLYLVEYTESERVGEETQKQAWVTSDDKDDEDKVLLEVVQWSAVEVGWGIER